MNDDELVFRLLPLACLLVAAAAAILQGPAWSAGLAEAPWLVSLAFVGLPHGAADLAITRRLCGHRATFGIWALYATLMAAAFTAFLLLPRTVVVLFMVLSIWHFGLSHAAGQSAVAPPSTLMRRALTAMARGGSVIGVPLATWPVETASVVTDVLVLTARGADASLSSFGPQAIRVTGIGLTVAAMAALAAETIANRRVAGQFLNARETLVDLIVIGLLGAVAHPLFAIGTYFLCWHGWRQMRPLAAFVATPSLPVAGLSGPSALLRRVAAVHASAMPLLVPTWIALGLAWWFLSAGHSLHDLAVLSLVMYVVVTPSHEALGGLLHWTAAVPRFPDRRLHPCVVNSASS